MLLQAVNFTGYRLIRRTLLSTGQFSICSAQDNAINCIGFSNTYPLDNYLSDG